MRALAALLLFATACHSVDRVDAPDFGAAKSLLVLGIEEDGRHAIAVDADADGVLRLPPLVQHSELDLWALSFTCSIQRVGYEAGPIVVNDGPTERPPLATPHEIFHTRIANGDGASWSEEPRSSALDDALSRLPPTPGVCASAGQLTTPTRVLLPSDGPEFFTYSVLLEDGRVVVGASSGNAYAIDRDGSAARVSTGHDRPLVAAFAHPLGPVFAIDDAGVLLRGDFDDGFVSTEIQAPMAVDADIADLVGPPSDEAGPFELFLVVHRADVATALSRFDGNEWTVLASRDMPGGAVALEAAWIGPGEVVTFGLGPRTRRTSTVTRFANGVITHEFVDGVVASVGYHERYGALAGTDNGDVYARTDGTWKRIVDRRGFVNVLRSVGPALWVNSVVGLNPPASQSWFWDEDRDVCAVEDDDGYILDLVPLGGPDYLRVNQIDFNGSFFVDLVSLDPPFVDCTGR